MPQTLVIINALSGGGAERSMNDLCNQFQQLGMDVELLAIESGPLDQRAFSGKVSSLHRNKGILGTANALFKFIRFVHSKPIRVALLNCELPELFGLFLPLKTRLLVIQHTPKPWSRTITLGKIVRRLLRVRSAVFISVSDHMKIWPTYSSPTAVIPNPLSLNYLPTEQKTQTIQKLIYIGRLVAHQKNPQQVIRIAKGVGLPVKFIGSGNFKSELESLAQLHGVNAEFSGYLTNPWQEFGTGEILIVPSLEEGDGLVVLEACAKGIPILMSDIPDFRRFDFDSKHYFAGDLNYIQTISSKLKDINYFVIDNYDALRILNERTIGMIGDTWKELIEGLGDQNHEKDC